MSATEIPGYKIIRTLGVGGQATVYLAIQQGFDREVALKVMSPALAADPTFGERFIREAKIVAKLSHKSIVTVYDVGESGNFYYLAMEYLQGGDLKTRIENGIKTRDCLTIIGKLGRALHFAHEKGYIHRDVKSENILFDSDGEPLLTDFGIAKASNSSTQMTQTGKLIGTPEYMSPEQCRGKTVDGRSDLYSLGIILYETLTRQVPYTGEDSVAVCIKHVTKPLPQLPARLKHIQWLLDSLLDKDPSKRFQNGLELAQAVENFEKTGQHNRMTTGGTRVIRKTKTKPTATSSTDHDDDELMVPLDEPEAFDEIHTEARYQITESEQGSAVGKIVSVILLLVIGAAGFFTKDKWFPQTEQWVSVNILGETSNAAGQQTTQGGNPVSSAVPANNQGTQAPNNAQPAQPSTADLLQEADALVQFVPQKIEDIKKALKLVATVRTLEPDNNNAQLIYQNILNTSLAEATTLAEKNHFLKANEWISLVEFEAAEHALLDATRNNIAQMKAVYDSQEANRKQKQGDVERWLSAGQAALAAKRLSSPQNDNAISFFQRVLKVEPQNQTALDGLKQVEQEYVKLINKAVADRTYSRAKAFLARFNSLSDDQNKKNQLRSLITEGEKKYAAELEQRRLKAAQRERARKAEEERLARLNDPMIQMRLLGSLDSAKSLEEQGALVLPEGNNALQKYQSALEIDAKNQDAIDGIARIEQKILTELDSAINAGTKDRANHWLTQLMLFKNDHPQAAQLQTAILNMPEAAAEVIPQEVELNDNSSLQQEPVSDNSVEQQENENIADPLSSDPVEQNNQQQDANELQPPVEPEDTTQQNTDEAEDKEQVDPPSISSLLQASKEPTN